MWNKTAGFIDGNGTDVRPPDEVQYRFGARHGELQEAFSTGEAYVRFFDNYDRSEIVNWCHLCKVPEQFKVGPTRVSRPKAGRAMTIEKLDRFWSKVAHCGPKECWDWQASRTDGYGRVWLHGRLHLAHRLSYE